MAKQLQHVYVTAHGRFVASSPWAGEEAQIGLRLATVPVATSPQMGETFTLPVGGDIAVTSGSTAGTNGLLTQAWDGLGGDSVLGLDWTGERQADIGDDFWTFLTAMDSYFTTDFEWTHIKIAPISADGSAGAGASHYVFTTPVDGAASSSAMMPPDVALCLSLRAPILGRTGRGRMYFPALATSVGVTDGKPGVAPRTAMAGYVKDLIDDLQNVPSGPFAYAPLVIVTSAGKATGVRPSQVRIGDHYDTQRRREMQVRENFVELAL